MIDWVRVADLRSEIGNEGFGEVIDLFLEEADEVIARLANSADCAEIGRDLHFLKGSALNLGFQELARLCQEGERRAETGESALADIARVVQVYHSSKGAFHTRLAHLPTA